ncbi:membrane protein insertase YidC [Candidatus Fokinia solitaria]|nr:membrane protein insertase YidC [Candidatus Fokinia solitaria]
MDKRFFTVLLLCVSFLIGWQMFVVPFFTKDAEKQEILAKKYESLDQSSDLAIDASIHSPHDTTSIDIENDYVRVQINPLGATLSEVNLKKFLDDSGKEIELLYDHSPRDYKGTVGFSYDAAVEQSDFYPSSQSLWNIHKIAENAAVLQFQNKYGIRFYISLELDESYILSAKYWFDGDSSMKISAYPFMKFQKNTKEYQYSIMYSKNDKLYEIGQSDDERLTANDVKWLGIGEKYWLLATFFPQKGNMKLMVKSVEAEGVKLIGYRIMLRADEALLPNKKSEILLFIGPKQHAVIQQCEEEYSLALFHKNMDFGILYFIVVPIYKLLIGINKFTNNFGISIIFLTIIIKTLLVPIAYSGAKNTKKISLVAPEIEKIKQQYGNDKIGAHNATMTLYKRYKIKPLRTLLMLLIQLPIFFSLYKIFSIAIEMRHASFAFWITDLSIPDPSNIFNLFGLLDLSLPSGLRLNLLSILMAGTLFIQQQVQAYGIPQSPEHNLAFKIMPIIMLFISLSFPSGLMIYWITSNVFSIAQQFCMRYALNSIKL